MSQKPMSFNTGGWQKSTNETVGLWSESLQSLSNVYMLKSCPLVYSIGQFAMNHGFAFIWEPGALPMLAPPSVEFKVKFDMPKCKVAHRMDHCVPVFQEQVEITSGLPVVPVRGEDAKEPPESLRLASAEEGRKDLENGSQVSVERGSKTFQATDKLHLTLRTTWLVNMAEWFLIEEQVQWQTLANRTAELPHVAHSLATLFEGPDSQARRAGQEASTELTGQKRRRQTRIGETIFHLCIFLLTYPNRESVTCV